MVDSWFLCTARLQNMPYQCMKFQDDNLYSIEVMALDKKANEKITKGNN